MLGFYLNGKIVIHIKTRCCVSRWERRLIYEDNYFRNWTNSLV